MADQGNNAPTTGPNDGQTEGNITYIWKIPVDRDYVKSIPSILKVVIAVLSFIAFICAASGRSENCDDDYSSTYNFFEFVTMSAFLTMLTSWILYALTICTRRLFKIVPWLLADIVIIALYILFYLIGNICIAAQSCDKDSNKAAAAFGFFAMFALVGHGFLSGRLWLEQRKGATSEAKTPSQEYNPDNMAQY